MFGSIFIGLSGMTAYSNALRQVSNNITNLNSTGYRATSVSFNDLFSNGRDGVSYSTNAVTGNGVSLNELRVDFTQGELRQSNRDLDLAVDGDGFLVLEKNDEYFYIRTGSFEIDSDGFVVLAGTDYKLTVLNEDLDPVSVSINDLRTNAPEATTRVEIDGILSTDAETAQISDFTVFNSQGEDNIWKVSFSRPELDEGEERNRNEWIMKIETDGGLTIGEERIIIPNFEAGEERDTFEFTFEDSELGVSIILDLKNVDALGQGTGQPLTVEEIDGFGVGVISGISVNDEGIFELQYDNEQTHEFGAVTLAEFDQPQLLEQMTGGIFAFGGTTGVDYLTDRSARVGVVRSGNLEASNVDLSAQFGDLILVQRGYQASSQVVSISNDMIQQLFGIRGQG